METNGSPPSPRTCHSMASVGSKFYVFGGGLSGPEPVPDNTVHVFNAGNLLHVYTEICCHFLIIRAFTARRNTLSNTTDTNTKLLIKIINRTDHYAINLRKLTENELAVDDEHNMKTV